MSKKTLISVLTVVMFLGFQTFATTGVSEGADVLLQPLNDLPFEH